MNKLKSNWIYIKKNKILILMAMPAVIYFLLFAYGPMFGGIVAFKDYRYNLGILGSQWAGLENFRFFFISGKALNVTLNTVSYNTVFIILNTVLELMFAIFLTEITLKLFRKVVQSIMLLPYFISWVTVGVLFFGFFSYNFGVVNQFLGDLGIDRINVYNDVSIWKYILPSVNAWKAVGYGTIYYFAAITGIDSELFEAAEIDGANIFQRIYRITLPSLIPTIIILTLLKIGTIFRGDIGLFYQLIKDNGVLFDATDVIDTYVFRSLRKSPSLGMAAAAGLYQSVLCFVTITCANYIIRKHNKDYALF